MAKSINCIAWVIILACSMRITFAKMILVPEDFSTITGAIDEARPGDTVLVASGEYNLSTGELFPIQMKVGVTLRTGNKTYPPVINAEGSQSNVISCINISPDSETTIQGFQITGGEMHPSNDVRGGGIYMYNASPIIMNCIIAENEASHGGGIDCTHNSNAIIYDCKIINNYSIYNGGGIHSYDFSDPFISGCTIVGNGSGLCGGGYFIAVNSSPYISDCIVKKNYAEGGGGGIHSGNLTESYIVNCLITENQAFGGNFGSGGGLRFLSTSDVRIINCTIADNIADSGGGLACISDGAPIQVKNCIFWSNVPDEIMDIYGDAQISFSDIRNGYPGNGNINADPLFVSDSDCREYFLSHKTTGHGKDSPCIDTGNDQADSICYLAITGQTCMTDRSTRTDGVGDTGFVDMGYHYTMEASPPSPQLPVEIELMMPSDFFQPNDLFYLDAHTISNGKKPYDCNLFIILEMGFGYYFYPSWKFFRPPEFSIDYHEIQVNDEIRSIIPEFYWPFVPIPSSQIVFWGACVDMDLTELVSNIDKVEWAFGLK